MQLFRFIIVNGMKSLVRGKKRTKKWNEKNWKFLKLRQKFFVSKKHMLTSQNCFILFYLKDISTKSNHHVDLQFKQRVLINKSPAKKISHFAITASIDS